jgi:hypothetical protein
VLQELFSLLLLAAVAAAACNLSADAQLLCGGS